MHLLAFAGVSALTFVVFSRFLVPLINTGQVSLSAPSLQEILFILLFGFLGLLLALLAMSLGL